MCDNNTQKKQRREMLDMQMKFCILCELYYCDKLKVHSVNPRETT